MTDLTLVIGNKNYSSWSFRPWLFLRMNHIPFTEVRIPLYLAESKANILRYSPSGKVPFLRDGHIAVWDSLAICEYAIERFALATAWPHDPAARAEARSLVAEMHSGFGALRSQLSMNCRREPRAAAFDTAAAADITRIDALWTSCRERFAAQGPGLLAPGRWLMPFTRPWCSVLIATSCLAARQRASTWTRCWRCLPCRNGSPPPGLKRKCWSSLR